MPNSALKNAIKEAMAVATTDVTILHTIQLSHPLAGDVYLISDNVNRTLTLEDATSHLFKAIGFRFGFPEVNSNGIQELTVTIDNVDRMASDYILQTKGSPVTTKVIYRPYLSNDFSQPQMDPPLQLSLKHVKIDPFYVTGTASFADVLNKTFLRETYHETRFPGIS